MHKSSAKHEIIEAVVLVGGFGTRLQSVVNDRPKPMAIVAGRPFMEWILLQLREQGVKRFILCTGHKAEKIEEYFGDGHKWAVEIVYSHEQTPLGTGGAVRQALPYIKTERFLVLNGDSYCKFDLQALINQHKQKNALATLWLVLSENAQRFGAVKLDENCSVQKFQEKSKEPNKGMINAGVYLIESESIRSIPEGTKVSIETEFFNNLVGQGLYGVVGNGPFLDIGTPEAYSSAEIFLENLDLMNIKRTV